MRQNPARRTAPLDAAIDVLVREGSRGPPVMRRTRHLIEHMVTRFLP